MALNFREMSLPVQALLFLVLAVVLIGVGLYVPSLPPTTKKQEFEAKEKEVNELGKQVAQLSDYQRRYAEFKQQMESQQKELQSQRNIVPEDKNTDDFIRDVHSKATEANVSIRRMTAKQIQVREGYSEMPFEIEVDGPYYAVMDFFARLGHVTRIINVGDIAFSGLTETRGKKYPVRPGTTVSGTFLATTFFTRGGEAPARQPGGPAPAPPAKR